MSTPTVEVPAAERGGEFVQSLARGLEVITAFDATHRELTLTEVAARTGLTRATARRFLHTLVTHVHVHVDGPRFRLTPRVLRLGYAFVSGLPLSEIAQPAPEGPVGPVAGVDLGQRPRRDGHPLRRPRAHAPDHGDADPGGHPVPRARHLDGPGAAGEPAGRRARRAPRPCAAGAADALHDHGRGRPARRARTGPSAGVCRGRPAAALGLRSVAVPVRQGERVLAAANVSMALHDGRSPHPVEHILTGLRESVARIEEELSLSP